jgi:prepilin-type N-terminal cleavage/methylation domain-containing protein
MFLHRSNRRSPVRRGLTLIELMIALSIMSIMAAALGSLSLAVQMSNQYALSNGTAVQHARVALERMERNMREAHASPEFPGFVVFSNTIGAHSYPDTVVIWKPNGEPVNPDGLPVYEELVIYCPNPRSPNELLEITIPSSLATVPDPTSTGTWSTVLDLIRANEDLSRVVITDLLRTALPSTDGDLRGVLRFQTRLRPSANEWENYVGGSVAWEDLPWAQGVQGSSNGLRQSWCQIELQLIPDGALEAGEDEQQVALPFFGSAALYYELEKP